MLNIFILTDIMSIFQTAYARLGLVDSAIEVVNTGKGMNYSEKLMRCLISFDKLTVPTCVR